MKRQSNCLPAEDCQKAKRWVKKIRQPDFPGDILTVAVQNMLEGIPTVIRASIAIRGQLARVPGAFFVQKWAF